MTEGISQGRMLLYIMIVCMLPIIYIGYRVNAANNRVDRLVVRLETVQQHAYLNEQKQAPNRAVRKMFQDADRSYLDKHVDTIVLLKDEVDLLEKITNNPTIAPDPRLTSRLDALKKNTIQFSEGAVDSYPFFKEVTETLAKTVEVNNDDIREILSVVEGVDIGAEHPDPRRPQLIFTEFKLEHKPGPRQGLLYSLNMKLIKREYF